MELDTSPKSRGSPTFSMPKKHHKSAINKKVTITDQSDKESDDSLDKDFMKIPKNAK